MTKIDPTNDQSAWNALNTEIKNCESCPRLIEYCSQVAQKKRKSYLEHDYWGKPVPNFGNPRSEVLLVGLAPAAHGANRTGRMFTGDRSGDFLFAALHRAGMCNQTESFDNQDGLILQGCAITAICHCAPPQNKPDRTELSNCRPWLEETLDRFRFRVFIALGAMAWNSMLQVAKQNNWHDGSSAKFAHGAELHFAPSRWLIGSYHPSQQNTFTGRLTPEMLDQVLIRANQMKTENQ